MQNVIFYIDGLNLYYGLKDKNWKKYYWLDIVKFCENLLLENQNLVEVNYFNAIPIDADRQERFKLFLSANKINPKFIFHKGYFLDKSFDCRNCNSKIIKYEEKETDVNIAVQMIRNIILKKNDISFLISADSDFLPPIKYLKEYDNSHKVIIAFPPERFSFNLQKESDNSIKLGRYESKFKKSMLPEEITLTSGYKINRPPSWN
jgi:uncharacterized LabA/DUF88 family protein